MQSVEIVKIDSNYICEMLKLQEYCLAKEPGSFVPSGRETYARAFMFDNFTIGALLEGELIGFLNCAAHNRFSARNLGRLLGYTDDELDHVGHMNTILVRPDYRKHGVALRLVEAAIKSFPPRVNYLIAATAPYNIPAQKLLTDFGFTREGAELSVNGVARVAYVLKRD